jgi:hypothetical protein
MIILWIFSIIDFTIALIIISASILPQKAVFYGALYMLGKGGFFAYTGDFISWLDIIVGVYMLFLVFGVGNIWISLIAFFYLLQKVVMSAL